VLAPPEPPVPDAPDVPPLPVVPPLPPLAALPPSLLGAGGEVVLLEHPQASAETSAANPRPVTHFNTVLSS
jgi:hypothetical protein